MLIWHPFYKAQNHSSNYLTKPKITFWQKQLLYTQSSNVNLASILQSPNTNLTPFLQSPNTNLALFYKAQMLI